MKTDELIRYIAEQITENDDVSISIERGHDVAEGVDGWVNAYPNGRETITIKINGGVNGTGDD
jgi:hypothetical protein